MFKISARTVLELGSELISSDIIAFYELIKNSFDAGSKSGASIYFNIVFRKNFYLSAIEKLTKKEFIDLNSLKSNIVEQINSDIDLSTREKCFLIIQEAKSKNDLRMAVEKIYSLNYVEIADEGSGMTSAELQKNFLVIGTSSRKRDVDQAIKDGVDSPYLGEKGIGRLSAMRLGSKLKVITKSKTEKSANILEVDWNEFNDPEKLISDVNVEIQKSVNDEGISSSGTRIIISGLSEDWTKKRVEEMVSYDFARLTDPFEKEMARPRIAIFWNGERKSIPRMPSELLNTAHAILKFSYNIIDNKPIVSYRITISDLGFEHPVEYQSGTVTKEDMMGIVGPSEELHESALVDVGPFEFEAYWFNRRRITKIAGLGDQGLVKNLQKQWSSLMLFRDNFRVFPYGDEDDDWLSLDRKALGRSGYALNKAQFIGRSNISRTKNPYLIDQTNREGLRENQSYSAFIGIIQMLIQEYLLGAMKAVEKQYKSQKIKIKTAEAELEGLEKRVKTSLASLKKNRDSSVMAATEQIEQTIFSYSDIVKKYRIRISEVEKESRQMTEMAGVGLMVEVVAHELARASENALINLNNLSKNNDPAEVDRKLSALKAQMKSLLKRLKILDVISVPGRQIKEEFDLVTLVNEVLDGHEIQFRDEDISVVLNVPEGPVKVKAVKGMFVQILENLISNSRYWMEVRKKTEHDSSYKPCIQIDIKFSPLQINFTDNGRGISDENYNRVFQPFFSLKERSKRRGLGLYIAAECAEYNKGVLYLDREKKNKDGRLNTFILELGLE